MPRVQSTPLIGLPLANGWSQITANEAGNLICAFSIAGKNAKNIGKDFSQQLKQTPANASAAALHQLLLSSIKNLRDNNCQLQLSAAFFPQEGQAFFLTYNGSITLKRGDKIGKILSSTNRIKIIQGEFKKEDVLLLTTHQVFKFLEEIKQKLNQGFELETVITSIVPAIHAQANSSLSALSFVYQKLSEEKVEKTKNLDFSLEIDTEAERLEQSLNTDNVLEQAADDIFKQKNKVKKQNELDWQEESIADPDLEIIDNFAPTQTTSNISKKRPNFQFKKFLKSASVLIKRGLSGSKNTVLKSLKLSQKILQKGSDFLKQNLSSKETYVSKYSSKKIAKVLFSILVFIIVGSTLIVVWRMKVNKELNAIREEINPFVQMIAEAKDIAEQDPITAREKLTLAIENLENLAKAKEQKKRSLKEIQKELSAAKDFYQEISGRQEFDELTVFVDLRNIESNFVSSKIAINKEKLAFLDTGKKQIIVINLDNKEHEVFNVEDADKLVDVVLGENKIYLLGNGIRQIDLGSKKITVLKEEGDSDRAGNIFGRFNSYLYILNPEKRNLYRYSQGEDGLSQAIGWFVSKKDIKFEEIDSMTIDGSIWLTTNSGEIKKFSKGSEVEFNIEGLVDAFDSKIKIFTSEELEYLYVLDANQFRVVALTKDGKYFSEKKSLSLKSVTDFVISKEKNKIFAVSGSLLYEMEL
ncbi:MAG: hypothetical protein PVJ09_04020 [Candidatus Woesebacteria bacterium]|jgi:hypothetical protein